MLKSVLFSEDLGKGPYQVGNQSQSSEPIELRIGGFDSSLSYSALCMTDRLLSACMQ